MRSICALLLLLLLSACAAGPELQLVRATGEPVELSDVAFFPQEEYQCGPAALATVLVEAGVEVTPEQLVAHMYIPARRGSLQTELVAATRGHGQVPYVMRGSVAPILAELRAGRPVLVFQNLGLERWPLWHYAVLVGFDPDREQFLLRSGTTRRHVMSAREFLATWDRAGRWSLVTVAASEPPVSADVVSWLQAVAPFESIGDLATAALGYEAAVKRWPEESLAWTALGNVRYRQDRLEEAEMAYAHALSLAGGLWSARNNLVRTLIARDCPERAERWVEQAGHPPVGYQETWQATLAALAAASGEADCPDP